MQVVLDILFALELSQVALVRALLKLRRYIVVGGLACLSPTRTMAIIDSKEIGVLTKVFEHAAGVLALLFFGSTAHEGGNVHFDTFEGVDFVFEFVISFVFLFLLFAFASPENTEEIHLG